MFVCVCVCVCMCAYYIYKTAWNPCNKQCAQTCVLQLYLCTDKDDSPGFADHGMTHAVVTRLVSPIMCTWTTSTPPPSSSVIFV